MVRKKLTTTEITRLVQLLETLLKTALDVDDVQIIIDIPAPYDDEVSTDETVLQESRDRTKNRAS